MFTPYTSCRVRELPSPEDVRATRRIIEAGKLLDIDVLDHIIVGEGAWISLREKGLGFE